VLEEKAGDGELVPQAVNGPAEQGDGLLAEFEDGLARAGGGLVEGFRQVEQQHDGDIAVIMAVAHVDARVRGEAAPEVDEGADGDVQVQLAALFLVAHPHLMLGLEEIEDLLQALGQGGVLGEQPVDSRWHRRLGCRLS
jgi:hypothetical protein